MAHSQVSVSTQLFYLKHYVFSILAQANLTKLKRRFTKTWQVVTSAHLQLTTNLFLTHMANIYHFK